MEKKKKALVTGGTSGIGLSIVQHLIAQNYEVTFIGRDESRGKALATSFNAEYPGSVTFVGLDLGAIKEVQDFAQHFLATHQNLDLLANIAGVVLPKCEMTAEGFEKTFAIGYLSAFVLCTQLSPLLAATPGARIVNVAAQAKSILNLKLDFEHLDFNQNYNGFKVSLMTVHAKTVLTAILAEKFATQGISVNAFHPGVVRSRLTRNLPYFFRLLTTFFSPLMVKTSESGCYVCSHPNISGITGQLFEKQTPRSLQFGSNYKEALWQKTIQLLSTIQKLNT